MNAPGPHSCDNCWLREHKTYRQALTLASLGPHVSEWIAFQYWGKCIHRAQADGITSARKTEPCSTIDNYSPATYKKDFSRSYPAILPKNILFVRFEIGTKKLPSAIADIEYAEAVSAVLAHRTSRWGNKKEKEYYYTVNKQQNLWIVHGALCVSEVDLSKEDAVALASEAENRKKRKLEKAHAQMDMNRSTENPSPRRPIPQEIKLSVWRRDQGRCVECGINANLEFDHIIPVSMGGANTERNLQLLCIDCNRRKGASL